MNKNFNLSIFSTKVSSLIVLLFFLIGFANEVLAHKVTAVSVVSRFDTKSRKYRLELAMDIYPSEDSAVNDKVSPQQAADFFSNEALILFFGDTKAKPESKTELLKDPDFDPEIEEQKVKVVVTLFGDIPKDAEFFTLQVSAETTAAVVMVTFKNGKPGRRAEVLYPGEFSSPVDLRTVVKGDPFVAAPASKMEGRADELEGGIGNLSDLAKLQSGAEGKGGGVQVPSKNWKEKLRGRLGAAKAKQQSGKTEKYDLSSSSMMYYTEIGARSFFSGRYEAVLIVLCLFFFSRKSIFLVRQLVMFTAAYTLALLLAVFGIESIMGMTGVASIYLAWGLPIGIVLLAIGNVFAGELTWWRQGIIALAGFLLGTVFSVTLSVSGLGAESVVTAFAGYYLGLGLAQIVTLLAVSLLVSLFWKRSWYQRAIAMPASLIIAGLAVYWVIDQAF